MTDLFRYLEHDFAVPSRVDAIDVGNDSDFQAGLQRAAEEPDTAAAEVRALSDEFLTTEYPSPTSDPATLGAALAGLGAALEEPSATLGKAVKDLFGKTPKQVASAADFKRDRQLLENAVVAAKLVTGFNRVDPARLAGQVRAAALIALAAAGPAPDVDEARRLLARPLLIPSRLLDVVTPKPPEAHEEPPPAESQERGLDAARTERDRLEAAYDALVAMPAESLQIVAGGSEFDRLEPERLDGPSGGVALPQGQMDLRLTSRAIEGIEDEHREALEGLGQRLDETPLPRVLETATRRLSDLNARLLPLEVATAATVFRVGGQLLAEPDVQMPTNVLSGPAPDNQPDPPLPAGFAKAVTRPVGYGNLQVVREELIGYEAGEISHIENVLKGESLIRTTTRVEETETIETEETTTTRSEERDHQSTDRNELGSETQKESGRQSSQSGGGMSSSEYGKLVENSRSNFAQSVVNRSVETLTSEVRRQRVRRETRRYTDQVEHAFDNHDGTAHVRGIYQWVDKKFSIRVLNYGRRLLYDVVVPEPAAHLVKALKDAVRPEAFQLVKPLPPALTPDDVRASNYAWYASRYGVTGSVTPPPEVYSRVVSHTLMIEGNKKLSYDGHDQFVPYSTAFKITVPEGYRAAAGYVQRVNLWRFLPEVPTDLEIYIGEDRFVRFGIGMGSIDRLNHSFTMKSQTGEVPVTVRTFERVVDMPLAVGIVCQRTDSAYAAWQLKTHATIVSGYQRMLADYEDRLTRYVAAVRVQMSAAGGYAHDESVVRDEFKRAFTFLLLGEHPAAWLATPEPRPSPPATTLPDPVAVRDWGAMVGFFERAFEWENVMHHCYPYYWGRPDRWQEMQLSQDADPQFEAFLKAGAARVVVPVRPGFEAALAHFHETGDVWMGEEMPDMFGEHYVSIVDELKASFRAPGDEVCVEQWEVSLPTTLVMLKEDATLPSWTPTPCAPPSP